MKIIYFYFIFLIYLSLNLLLSIIDSINQLLNLFSYFFGMIATKLFQTGQKQLLKKPERIKIKHKTYRELLGLDRPKKKIQVESDNQNDDFLEKLLKEQQKQKKKKHSLKKTQNKKKSAKKPIRQNIDSNEMKKETNNVIKIQKSSQILPNSRQQKEKEKQIPEIDKILIQNERKKSAKSYRSNIQNKNSLDNIKVDESNQVPYIFNNFLLNSLTSIRSNKGFQALNQVHHQRRSQPSLNININHKINPQAHAIIHEFNSESKYKKFKANVLSINQIMSMTGRFSLKQPKRITLKKEKLFQRQQDEDLFIKSLRTVKQRKFQKPMPSLL